jgi:hypothetical protein
MNKKTYGNVINCVLFGKLNVVFDDGLVARDY